MEPNWTQNGIKNRSQLQHANFQKSLKNHRKINTFGVPRGRSWDRKSTKNRSEKEVPKGARLGIDFGWIWDGLGVQVEPQNGPKFGKNRALKGIKILWTILCRFSSRLGGQVGSPRPAKDAPKGGLKGGKFGTLYGFPPRDSSGDLSGNHFGIDFGVILGSFWGHLGVILGSSWNLFGVMLGPFSTPKSTPEADPQSPPQSPSQSPPQSPSNC